MAARLWAAVYSEMLGTGGSLNIIGVIALQALDKRNTQQPGQIGVFAVGFLTATSAGVSENIDVG